MVGKKTGKLENWKNLFGEILPNKFFLNFPVFQFSSFQTFGRHQSRTTGEKNTQLVACDHPKTGKLENCLVITSP
jgi:hypothetical protein